MANQKKLVVESMDDLRKEIASQYGLLCRLHGVIGLKGDDKDQRIKALEEFCKEKK